MERLALAHAFCVEVRTIERHFAELAALAPQLASFLISFGLASLWWVVHLSATRDLRTFDWPTTIGAKTRMNE